MFSVLTNIYNKKTKGPTVMELFKATGKLKKCFFFLTTKSVRCVCAPRVTWPTSIFKFLPLTRVNVSAFCLHRHPVSVNCLYHARMVLSVGCSFACFARNTRCKVTTDLLVWYSSTQNDFSPGAAIFSLHALASPSSRNVNCDEKQLTGKKSFWVVPSISTGFVNTCPTVFL